MKNKWEFCVSKKKKSSTPFSTPLSLLSSERANFERYNFPLCTFWKCSFQFCLLSAVVSFLPLFRTSFTACHFPALICTVYSDTSRWKCAGELKTLGRIHAARGHGAWMREPLKRAVLFLSAPPFFSLASLPSCPRLCCQGFWGTEELVWG